MKTIKRATYLQVVLLPRLRKGARWLAVVLVLFLIAGGGLFVYLGKAKPEEAYLTAKVERGDIEDTVSALGTLQPLQFVDVGTQVTGQLKTVYVKVGQTVRKGQLIAQIDPVLFDSRAGMTEASLLNAQAQLSEKQVQQKLAQQLYERNKGLYENQAVSEELLEQSKAALDQAAQQTEEQQAQLAQIQSQLKGDRANLAYTKIFAPMSGTVVAVLAREGQTLVANQQAPIILRIADLTTMTVWAQVSEADVPKIALNSPVSFSPIGLPNRRWHSKVRQVLPTPEIVNAVVLYDVLFDVPNKEQLLQPQMTVQSNFVVAKAENTLLVPVTALQAAKHHKGEPENKVKEAALNENMDPQAPKALKDKKDPMDSKDRANRDDVEDTAKLSRHKYMVRVVTESGQVEERRVAVGVMSRLKAEVLSGLAEGETVIVGMPEETGKSGKSKAPAGTAKL